MTHTTATRHRPPLPPVAQGALRAATRQHNPDPRALNEAFRAAAIPSTSATRVTSGSSGGSGGQLSVAAAMDAAFAGAPCEMVLADDTRSTVAAASWAGDASPSDHRLLLDACQGPTLDLGCGPGRLTGALTRHGVRTLGTDISGEAVRQTRARGGTAMQRDVFGDLPGLRSWRHVLLADGNIGIGGDPVMLLRRVARLLHPDGTAHVELSPTDVTRVHTGVRLQVAGRVTAPFAWATVGASAISDLAAAAGLHVTRLDRAGHRAVVSLRPRPAH